MRPNHINYAVVFAILATCVLPAIAEDKDAVRRGVLWRLELDNDIIDDSDDNYSGGWGVLRYSAPAPSWTSLKQGPFSRWITKVVPGLQDGTDVWVGRGFGIKQGVQTPTDTKTSELLKDDVPYAGVLAVPASWYTVSDERFSGFQILLGVVGPASLGEDVQRFVHDNLDFGDSANGWEHQLENEPLLNMNYARLYKLSRAGVSDGFGADLSAGYGLGAGNLFTTGNVEVQCRAGHRMPLGFVPLPDMAGRGVISDPTLDLPADRLSAYLTLTGRMTGIAYTVLWDGNMFQDSNSVNYDHYLAEAIFGAHLARDSWGFHLSYYLTTNPNDTNLSWANVSFDYRF